MAVINFYWAESTYYPGKCRKCGKRLRNKDGSPVKTLLVRHNGEEHEVYCPKCFVQCGKYKIVETPEKADKEYMI